MIVAIGLVLLFLLSHATNNRALYERHYVWLFWVNVVVAGAAGAGHRLGRACACCCAAARAASSAAGCWSSWRRSSRWSASCPGVLIYTVSYQFVSRSIESWFDVKVEGALDAGLNLGRGTLDTLASDLGNQDARWPPSALAETPDAGRAAGARAPARAAVGAATSRSSERRRAS